MADCYYVRVNPSPSTALNGVTIFDKKGKGLDDISVANGTPMCFVEDPIGASAIKNFTIGVESCSFCKNVSWDANAKQLSLTASPSFGTANLLLLKATASGQNYLASKNPPELDGGRPIIRNNLDRTIFLTVGFMLIVVAIVAIYRWSKRSSLQ